MRSLLLTNLARVQAFDAALRAGESIDSITSDYVDTVLYQRDADKRLASLAKLQAEIVRLFDMTIQPAARTIGLQNARSVLAATPPAELPTAAFRQRILYEGKAQAEDRVRIVQALVNDKANTLNNRLTAYYLEPGLKPAEKLATLKHLHEKDLAATKAYNSALKKNLAGDGPKPGAPQVDFMQRLNNEVKKDVRTQARRAGTAAETQTLQAAGHEMLSWVTVNASEACPDCRRRQGVNGDIAFWDRSGRPGSGSTICGASCFCLLIPSTAMEQNPDLKNKGLETNPDPVATTPAIAARLNAEK